MEITFLPTNTSKIHQKYIDIWNNSYRTPTERWQKTSDFPKDIYGFFPFSLFVSVYVYVSLFDFVCIALLSPFALGFCLFVFVLFCFVLFCFVLFSIVFSTCYHRWI